MKSVYVDPQRQKAGQMAEQDTQKVLRKEFLDAMSRAVSSVCVVTTDGPAGRAGVTVSAMTSVSADGDAPTMLVCVNATASAAPLLLENKAFCINILAQEQSEISDIFSSRAPAPGGDKFNAITPQKLVTGAPVFAEALAGFDCRLISAERIGTHYMCLGAVEAAQSGEGRPLLYGMRSYQRAEPS